MPTGHRGGASPTPPSAFVRGGSVGDLPTAMVAASRSSPPSVDAKEGVVVLSAGAIGEYGATGTGVWQRFPHPGR